VPDIRPGNFFENLAIFLDAILVLPDAYITLRKEMVKISLGKSVQITAGWDASFILSDCWNRFT